MHPTEQAIIMVVVKNVVFEVSVPLDFEDAVVDIEKTCYDFKDALHKTLSKHGLQKDNMNDSSI